MSNERQKCKYKIQFYLKMRKTDISKQNYFKDFNFVRTRDDKDGHEFIKCIKQMQSTKYGKGRGDLSIDN